MKTVLVVGAGAREHTIVWKLSQSSQVKAIWVAPGNPGTAAEPKTNNIPIAATNIQELITFAKKNAIDLTIIGPEIPLSLGIVDAFQAENLLCLGPTKKAAELETSKAFAKAFMQRNAIPTAKYAEFSDVLSAETYLDSLTFPQVIKADGLAAGKGVIIAQNQHEAKNAVNELLKTSSKIIIEEFLSGFEVSFIILTDGKTIIPLATAQDNKRRNNANTGPNTGGMGACSPAPYMTEKLQEKIMRTVIQPTLEGMKKENRPFTGFLFAGLMITSEEEPKVLEFNCRLGDPETQAILMRLQSDFFELCLHATECHLAQSLQTLQWDTRPALSLVLATSQYPESSVKNEVISGIPEHLPENMHIFHAGTHKENQQILANGGRILSISVIDDNFETAREKAYAIANKIHWPSGTHYRDDIGNNF